MTQFDGKVAVITGGAQGLGAAVAALFAERGAQGIVICARSKDKGEKKARELAEASGAQVRFVAADLALVDDCRAVIAAADEQFGRIDVLVNAAATTDRGTILDTDPELFDRMFATNVRAPFFMMQDTIRIMKRERNGGRDRQYLLDVGDGGAAVHRCILRIERRTRHAHAEHGLCAAAQSYSRERAESRLDGERGRGPHSAHASWSG